MIRRLTDKFNHHRVKVYHLRAFRDSRSAAHTEARTRRESERCDSDTAFQTTPQWMDTRAVRYGQKIYIPIFFFDFDFNHDFDKQTCFISHLTCLAHLVLHFSLFYYTFYSSFFYLYIYALVWCYFYIIFILCTVHWADLIWSTFHFWLYPV